MSAFVTGVPFMFEFKQFVNMHVVWGLDTGGNGVKRKPWGLECEHLLTWYIGFPFFRRNLPTVVGLVH